jgi:hypothetical protein
MDAATRRQVRDRGGEACEYCRLPQSAQPFATFHVDHVIASQHRQDDGLENLCLSCQSCNLLKGPNLSSIDPETDQIVRLFHPRTDVWNEHFRFEAGRIVGLTNIGRATVRLMAMNTPRRIELRRLRGVGLD